MTTCMYYTTLDQASWIGDDLQSTALQSIDDDDDVLPQSISYIPVCLP